MNENYYNFKKFCELINDSNVLKKHSVVGVIKMLQLCISEIKSDVFLKLSNEGQNNYYLDYLINEIEKQDYLKNFGIEKIEYVLNNLNVTIEEIINTTFSQELNDTIGVKLSWDEYYENFDYLRSTQENLLLYFINYYANELITFLNSIKSDSTQKQEASIEASKNIKLEKEKSIFSSISFRFDKDTTAEDFHKLHIKSNYFKDSLSKNPNFLRELLGFLCDDNRTVKTTYEIFDKKLNLYLVNGHSLFFMRFSKASSVVIYPASLKMEYLEELKRRKSELRFFDKKQLDEVIKETYDLRDSFTQKFSDFFSYDENIKNNASIYSAILLQSVRDLLKTALPYFKNPTEDQVLGFNDNRLNITKSEIKYSFQTYHNLIRHISLNHSPHLEHKAVEFLFSVINNINKRTFEFSYLFEVLESEANKIYNDKVYQKIIEKNKLLETHKFYSVDGKALSKVKAKFKNDIFKSIDSQNWFNNTLQELAAIDNENKPERSFQAICNAVFRDENCKKIIFKNRLPLNKYIQFLNEVYEAQIKSETNLSNPINYVSDVKKLIDTYQNSLSTNKPE